MSLLSGHKASLRLFGSLARGDAGSRSDIDLAAVGAAPLPADLLASNREALGEAPIPFRIRACFENGLLDEAQTRLALAMTDHRNLTSHTYNEPLADEIFAAIPAYRELKSAWLEKLAAA